MKIKPGMTLRMKLGKHAGMDFTVFCVGSNTVELHTTLDTVVIECGFAMSIKQDFSLQCLCESTEELFRYFEVVS